MKLLQIIADLLEYPATWTNRKEEIWKLAYESDSPNRHLVLEFLKIASNYNELDLEEMYVRTFDNNDYTTLNMTYYITGDEKSRTKPPQRGFLLVWLKERVKPSGNELPDYLPYLLRYLSENDDYHVKDVLKNPMRMLTERLNERKSVFYPLVLAAYLELYGGENVI